MRIPPGRKIAGHGNGTIRVELAEDAQTMLAYEINGQPLRILHGAAPTSSRNAVGVHHGEVHPRDRVYRGGGNLPEICRFVSR